MVWARWALAVLAMVVSACTPLRLGPGKTSQDRLITEHEIEASHGSNAYDVIAELRAGFLTYRGETSLYKSRSTPYPTVWVDGMEYGPIASLRNVPAGQISTIRLYRSWDATTKFGVGNMGGVIEITTRQ